jgi:hypothetical protein
LCRLDEMLVHRGDPDSLQGTRSPTPSLALPLTLSLTLSLTLALTLAPTLALTLSLL